MKINFKKHYNTPPFTLQKSLLVALKRIYNLLYYPKNSPKVHP